MHQLNKMVKYQISLLLSFIFLSACVSETELSIQKHIQQQTHAEIGTITLTNQKPYLAKDSAETLELWQHNFIEGKIENLQKQIAKEQHLYDSLLTDYSKETSPGIKRAYKIGLLSVQDRILRAKKALKFYHENPHKTQWGAWEQRKQDYIINSEIELGKVINIEYCYKNSPKYYTKKLFSNSDTLFIIGEEQSTMSQ